MMYGTAFLLSSGKLTGCRSLDVPVAQAPVQEPVRQVVRRSGPLQIRSDNPSIMHSYDNCGECGGCQNFCQNTMDVFGRTTAGGEDACTYCGQCTIFCTRGAITERFHHQQVSGAIAASDKIVITTTAPAIRVALGEMYGYPVGTNVEGRIVGAMKHIGVDHVLDATFGADLTVMEEAAELLKRLENGGNNPLPMFTSCCPAWVRYVRLFYPRLLPNLSTVKSPLLMQGVLAKTYFAQKMGIDPAKIVSVALTPCTAKKAEILLAGMNSAGVKHGKTQMRDVDYVLTTREIAYLLNGSNVNFDEMRDAPYGDLMGTGSGAGMIFGNTGGVMEAALRTAYRFLNGHNPPARFFNLTSVRGLESVRRATVDMGKRTLNIAVVHGTGNLRPFLDSIQNGTSNYDFVEVMACAGGCIGGGGQPVTAMDPVELKRLRKNGLYHHDNNSAIRVSYDNPQIKAIYRDFLGEPLGNKAKRLLHTYH